MKTKSTFGITFIAQKGKLKSDGKAPIMCRIIVNGESAWFSTKLNVLPERWIGNSGFTIGKTREDKEINTTLDDYRALIKQRYNEIVFRGEVVTAEKVKLAVTNLNSRRVMLLEVCDQFIEDYYSLVTTGDVTRTTYQRYILTRERLAEFTMAKYKMQDIPLADINYNFIKGFDLWTRTEHASAHNTAVRFIKHFRTMYNLALNNGWITVDPFASYKLKKETVNRDFLSMQEINRLLTKDLPNERLAVIRDMFIFSCFTGLAYIDVRELTHDNIVQSADGSLWIDTTRHKTNNPVNVQLLDIPKRIVDKYSGKGRQGRLLPIPSNQKVNDYLKEIAALCDIDKNLTFHVARHTFATTVTIENDVPIETVSKMLGHSSIKTTQIYARITKKKIGNDMDALGQKLQGRVAQAANM
ncbi:site-specific integrase [Alistipes sp. OttesenSCG-928-B03]|nr:site-specific integrase [Alistipes sp. OttesenSCG-928-B03]